MTLSREQLDQKVSVGRPLQDYQMNPDRPLTEGMPPKPLAPPFDEPIYTVNEVAKILRLSPEQVRTIFRNQPGVHDLSADSATSRFLKRKSQLRIPHAVLVGFWKRTEIAQQQNLSIMKNKRPLRRAA